MPRDNLSPAVRDLRENLRAAAHAQAQARQRARARRQRRRRVLVIALASLAAVAGVATAARLLAIGEPVGPGRDVPAPFRPGPEPRTLVLRTPDPAGGLPWAAAIYESSAGRECILVGRARGTSLGIVDGDVFRPYSQERGGACGDLERVRSFFSTAEFAGPPPRTLVFGRAREPTSRIRVRGPEGSRDIAPGVGGAFLLVYEGRVVQSQVRVEPR